MTSLPLQPLDTGTEKIDNASVSTFFYHGNKFHVEIKETDIRCDNKEEILDSLARRGEEYFYNSRRKTWGVQFTVKFSGSLILDRIRPRDIEKVYNEAGKNLKNTVEDVFGVGCE